MFLCFFVYEKKNTWYNFECLERVKREDIKLDFTFLIKYGLNDPSEDLLNFKMAC